MHLVARLVAFGIGWIFKIDFNRYNNVLRILNYAVVQDNSPINFFFILRWEWKITHHFI